MKLIFKIFGVFVALLIGLVILGSIVGEDVKDDRPTWVKSQFSEWDGSHKKLEKFVKSTLKNPKSYEHVSSKYVQSDSYLTVLMTYRAENSFGATVTEQIRAMTDTDGNIIKIFSE